MEKIEITENFRLPGTKIILEKGDVIEVQERAPQMRQRPQMQGAPERITTAKANAVEALEALYFQIERDSSYFDEEKIVKSMIRKIGNMDFSFTPEVY